MLALIVTLPAIAAILVLRRTGRLNVHTGASVLFAALFGLTLALALQNGATVPTSLAGAILESVLISGAVVAYARWRALQV